MDKTLRTRRRLVAKGQTLTELNVVLSIISLLSLSATFQWSEILGKYRLEGFAHVMAADLKYARSQAVALNQTVTVTFTNSGYTICSPDCSATSRIFKMVTVPTHIALQAANSKLAFYPYALVNNISPEMATANTISTSSSDYTTQLNTLIDSSGQIEICAFAGANSDFATCTS
jgi:Tfp pilus assembly protein FimT